MTTHRAALLASSLLCSAVLIACKADSVTQVSSGQFSVTEPLLLTTNSPTKDEDPSVLRAHDGTMFIAWFSDRGGNPDIYIANISRGTTWSAPTRVTTSQFGDFNP